MSWQTAAADERIAASAPAKAAGFCKKGIKAGKQRAEHACAQPGAVWHEPCCSSFWPTFLPVQNEMQPLIAPCNEEIFRTNGSAPVLARLFLLSLSLLSMASGLQAGLTQIFHPTRVSWASAIPVSWGLVAYQYRTVGHTVGQALHAPWVQTPDGQLHCLCAL